MNSKIFSKRIPDNYTINIYQLNDWNTFKFTLLATYDIHLFKWIIITYACPNCTGVLAQDDREMGTYP